MECSIGRYAHSPFDRRKFDFSSSSRADQCLECLLAIEKQLVEKGKLVKPAVHFSNRVKGALLDRLTSICKRKNVGGCSLENK